jgi:hypothetical protein
MGSIVEQNQGTKISRYCLFKLYAFSGNCSKTTCVLLSFYDCTHTCAVIVFTVSLYPILVLCVLFIMIMLDVVHMIFTLFILYLHFFSYSVLQLFW